MKAISICSQILNSTHYQETFEFRVGSTILTYDESETESSGGTFQSCTGTQIFLSPGPKF